MNTHDERERVQQMRAQRAAQEAPEPIMFAPLSDPAEAEQRALLALQDEAQERAEKAFCWGMLVGGAIALTVVVGTLKVVGVL